CAPPPRPAGAAGRALRRGSARRPARWRPPVPYAVARLHAGGHLSLPRAAAGGAADARPPRSFDRGSLLSVADAALAPALRCGAAARPPPRLPGCGWRLLWPRARWLSFRPRHSRGFRARFLQPADAVRQWRTA